MTGETVSVEIELARETHDALAAAGNPSETLSRLAEDERRIRESVRRSIEREDGGGDGRASRSESVLEHAPPICVLLGFETVSAEPGRAVLSMEAGPRHTNPMGTLHGGVLCDLGDAAMGHAFASTLAEGESFTTLELSVNYLKPVWEGELTATGGGGQGRPDRRSRGV